METRPCSLIVIGASAGGIEALRTILSALKPTFSIPIVVVLHLPINGSMLLPTTLASVSLLELVEAWDKCSIEPGLVYFAPGGYHLLVEETGTLALSVDEPVNYSRPSIDVLFESAARTYREKLLGILLTGANGDGANGLRTIKEFGGQAVVEDPTTAAVATMPRAGLAATKVDYVLPCNRIGPFLQTVTESGVSHDV